MSQQSGRRTAIVGLFILGALGGLIGGVLAVGDLKEALTRKITLTATFDEVSGLQTGDNVWCSGMKVGVVSDMHVTDDAHVEVQMRVDADISRYVHTDATANLGSDGLIGNPIVILHSGSASAPPIQDGDSVRPADTTTSADVMATFQENNRQLLGIMEDIKQITAQVRSGEGTLGKLLADDTLHDKALAAIAALEATAAQTEVFASNLNRQDSLPHQLVTDRTTYDTLTKTVAQLEAASASAQRVADKVAKSTEDPDTPVGQVLSDEGMVQEMDEVLGNLVRASELLVVDLKALQSNWFFRGYFKRKRKAATAAAAAQDAADTVTQ